MGWDPSFWMLGIGTRGVGTLRSVPDRQEDPGESWEPTLLGLREEGARVRTWRSK